MDGKTSNNKGELSAGLRRKLGEDLAQMFDSVGRKLYADLRERLRTCVAESLREHRANLQSSVKEEFGRQGATQAEEHVSDWLNEVIGDSVTSVAQEVHDDLPAISEAMLEEAESDEESDDESDESEDGSDDSENSDDSEEETEGKSKKGKGKKAAADDLDEIKAEALALAARIASSGAEDAADNAAFVRMAVADL